MSRTFWHSFMLYIHADIDECGTFSKSKLGCTSKLKCFNTIGSYYCACDQGYKKIDKKCEGSDVKFDLVRKRISVA